APSSQGGKMRKSTIAACICLFGLTTLAMGQGPNPPVPPDSPPRASLITVSGPDASGSVLVMGAAGAVPGGSTIALITLDTGHFAKVVAAENGSFAGSIFAAASASILIKADPTGYFIQQLYSTPDGFGNPSILGALTGTIVRVPDPISTASGVAFSASGPATFGDPIQPPVYTLQGTISSATLQPGGSL